jgi:hypothetical protein
MNGVPLLKYYWATLFSTSLARNDIFYMKYTWRKFSKGVDHGVNGLSNYTKFCEKWVSFMFLTDFTNPYDKNH